VLKKRKTFKTNKYCHLNFAKITHKYRDLFDVLEKCNDLCLKMSNFGNYRQHLRNFDKNLPKFWIFSTRILQLSMPGLNSEEKFASGHHTSGLGGHGHIERREPLPTFPYSGL
jgi:hypothetical protein